MPKMVRAIAVSLSRSPTWTLPLVMRLTRLWATTRLASFMACIGLTTSSPSCTGQLAGEHLKGLAVARDHLVDGVQLQRREVIETGLHGALDVVADALAAEALPDGGAGVVGVALAAGEEDRAGSGGEVHLVHRMTRSSDSTGKQAVISQPDSIE